MGVGCSVGGTGPDNWQVPDCLWLQSGTHLRLPHLSAVLLQGLWCSEEELSMSYWFHWEVAACRLLLSEKLHSLFGWGVCQLLEECHNQLRQHFISLCVHLSEQFPVFFTDGCLRLPRPIGANKILRRSPWRRLLCLSGKLRLRPEWVLQLPYKFESHGDIE